MCLWKNLEKFVFCAIDDDDLHKAKQGILTQMIKFDITINALGFFDIDRRVIAAVCWFSRRKKYPD